MKVRNEKKRILLCRAAALAALLVMTGLLCGCGQGALSPVPGTPQKSENTMKKLFETKEEILIDCLGDSITWGMYSTPQLLESIENGEIETGFDDGGQMFDDYGIYISGAFQSDPSYPEVLQDDLNQKLNDAEISAQVKTVNDGICGDWITKETYKRMSCDPDLVVLLMGGNNFNFDISIDGMLEYNIEALEKQGKIVVHANYLLWPGGRLADVFHSANEELARVAEKEDVLLIDLNSQVEEMIGNGEFKRAELFSDDHVHLSEKGYALIGQLISDAIFKEIES